MDGENSVIGAVLVAAISSVTTWAVSRRSAKAPERAADAHIQEQINAGFQTLAVRYEARDKALTDHIEALAAEIHDLTRHVESMEATLRAHGLPVPERAPRPALAPLKVVGA